MTGAVGGTVNLTLLSTQRGAFGRCRTARGRFGTRFSIPSPCGGQCVCSEPGAGRVQERSIGSSPFGEDQSPLFAQSLALEACSHTRVPPPFLLRLAMAREAAPEANRLLLFRSYGPACHVVCVPDSRTRVQQPRRGSLLTFPPLHVVLSPVPT
jgi:hypothetical protein